MASQAQPITPGLGSSRKINPLIAIGLPTWGKVSVNWARAFRHLGGLLGSSAVEFIVTGQPIAKARNQLMQEAIASGADFLFTLADDVLPPGDAIARLLQRMRDHPDVHIVTGIYWTKAWPTSPYIWRGMQRGPYVDWRVGEFFEVDFAGCDCLLTRLSPEVQALGPEWYSTEWTWTPNEEKPGPLMTEDFYFYTRARQAGLKLWCDTGVQCLHEDRGSGMLFGLTNDMPQTGASVLLLPEPAPAGEDQPPPLVRVADIGCGHETPWFGPADKVVILRFDGDESVNPTFRCDIRHLPVDDQCVDLVHSRHVFEHFGRDEALSVLHEWLRILRVGGELRLSVPNLLHAIEEVRKQEAGDTPPDRYAWWQLYGAQVDHRDVHRNGWTPRRLKLILERTGVLEDVNVITTDDGLNLQATARKCSHSRPFALTPAWDEIERQEGISVPGLARVVSPAPMLASSPVSDAGETVVPPSANGETGLIQSDHKPQITAHVTWGGDGIEIIRARNEAIQARARALAEQEEADEDSALARELPARA